MDKIKIKTLSQEFQKIYVDLKKKKLDNPIKKNISSFEKANMFLLEKNKQIISNMGNEEVLFLNEGRLGKKSNTIESTNEDQRMKMKSKLLEDRISLALRKLNAKKVKSNIVGLLTQENKNIIDPSEVENIQMIVDEIRVKRMAKELEEKRRVQSNNKERQDSLSKKHHLADSIHYSNAKTKLKAYLEPLPKFKRTEKKNKTTKNVLIKRDSLLKVKVQNIRNNNREEEANNDFGEKENSNNNKKDYENTVKISNFNKGKKDKANNCVENNNNIKELECKLGSDLHLNTNSLLLENDNPKDQFKNNMNFQGNYCNNSYSTKIASFGDNKFFFLSNKKVPFVSKFLPIVNEVNNKDDQNEVSGNKNNNNNNIFCCNLESSESIPYITPLKSEKSLNNYNREKEEREYEINYSSGNNVFSSVTPNKNNKNDLTVVLPMINPVKFTSQLTVISEKNDLNLDMLNVKGISFKNNLQKEPLDYNNNTKPGMSQKKSSTVLVIKEITNKKNKTKFMKQEFMRNKQRHIMKHNIESSITKSILEGSLVEDKVRMLTEMTNNSLDKSTNSGLKEKFPQNPGTYFSYQDNQFHQFNLVKNYNNTNPFLSTIKSLNNNINNNSEYNQQQQNLRSPRSPRTRDLRNQNSYRVFQNNASELMFSKLPIAKILNMNNSIDSGSKLTPTSSSFAAKTVTYSPKRRNDLRFPSNKDQINNNAEETEKRNPKALNTGRLKNKEKVKLESNIKRPIDNITKKGNKNNNQILNNNNTVVTQVIEDNSITNKSTKERFNNNNKSTIAVPKQKIKEVSSRNNYLNVEGSIQKQYQNNVKTLEPFDTTAINSSKLINQGNLVINNNTNFISLNTNSLAAVFMDSTHSKSNQFNIMTKNNKELLTANNNNNSNIKPNVLITNSLVTSNTTNVKPLETINSASNNISSSQDYNNLDQHSTANNNILNNKNNSKNKNIIHDSGRKTIRLLEDFYQQVLTEKANFLNSKTSNERIEKDLRLKIEMFKNNI